MAKTITKRLDAGAALDSAGTTSIWSSRATVSAAPSADPTTIGSGYIACSGVQWVDLWVTVATAAVEVTVYAWNVEADTWCVDTAFGVSGVLSCPVGANRYSHEAMGADWLYVRVTDVSGGGDITIDATLSQPGLA